MCSPEGKNAGKGAMLHINMIKCLHVLKHPTITVICAHLILLLMLK